MLTTEQEKICKLRLDEHKHKTYEINLNIGKTFLSKFLVYSGVFRPETTSAIYMARFLEKNKSYYSGKRVLDLCCGTGIQGIITAFNGANYVCLSDICENAIANAKENVKNYGLVSIVDVFQGDLFENVKGQYDLIICNHPFFDADPLPNEPITRAWFNNGELLSRFFIDANKYLKENGICLLPFFQFAGEKNDPINARKFGYNVNLVYNEFVDDNNIQKGDFNIDEIKI